MTVSKMNSDDIPLTDIVTAGFEELATNRDGHVKIVALPAY